MYGSRLPNSRDRRAVPYDLPQPSCSHQLHAVQTRLGRNVHRTRKPTPEHGHRMQQSIRLRMHRNAPTEPRLILRSRLHRRIRHQPSRTLTIDTRQRRARGRPIVASPNNPIALSQHSANPSPSAIGPSRHSLGNIQKVLIPIRSHITLHTPLPFLFQTWSVRPQCARAICVGASYVRTSKVKEW